MQTSLRTPSKTIRILLASALLRQFGSYFGIFDIEGETQYISRKYIINLYSLQNRTEKFNKGSLFYLFLSLYNFFFFYGLLKILGEKQFLYLTFITFSIPKTQTVKLVQYTAHYYFLLHNFNM